MHLKTEIDINAPIEIVWRNFFAFDTYPEWSPFIKRFVGTPKVGEKVTVTLQPPGGNGMDISPNVINVDAPREFRWKGKLFVKGIFDGEHVFRFEQTGDATTHFIHEEFFGGIFKGLIMAKIWDSTEQGFREYNEALKARAEAEYKEAAS